METNNKENMRIYNLLKSVPEKAQKPFNNGKFKGTDINPMWRIKRMTELFGMCGVGWYCEILKREIIQSPDGTQSTFIALNLYVKVNGEWSKPIYGEGGNTFYNETKNGWKVTSDEAYKMAYTDAFGNATKYIGLGADVWFERDMTKYTAPQQQAAPAPAPQQQAAPAPAPQQQAQSAAEAEKKEVEKAIAEVMQCKTTEEVKQLYNVKYKQLQRNQAFRQYVLKVGEKLQAESAK